MGGSRFFIERERWLAVADLHFGYELSQRAAGRLIPFWGMASIAERSARIARGLSAEPLDHPRRSRPRPTAARFEARELLERIPRVLRSRWSWRETTTGSCDGTFELFDSLGDRTNFISITVIARLSHRIGSRSSGIIIRLEVEDGAGLRLKLPGFRSAIAAGSCRRFPPGRRERRGRSIRISRVWLCTPKRIFACPRSTAIRLDVARCLAISVVQCGQRVALIGIVIAQAGQSFETGPLRPASARFILLIARTTRKMQNATMRKLIIRVMKLP